VNVAVLAFAGTATPTAAAAAALPFDVQIIAATIPGRRDTRIASHRQTKAIESIGLRTAPPPSFSTWV
jgi:hypothetical protein